MDLGNLIQLAAALIFHIWLAIVVWRSVIRRRYPWFFAYCAYSVLGTSARLGAVPSPYAYSYVYLWTDPGFLVLGICAMQEVFRDVFAGFYLLPWFRRLYYGGIIVTVLIAVLNSIVNRPVHVPPLAATLLDIGIAINCIQAAIFALFYLSAKLLDMAFRRHSFGIVLGFGIASIGTLVPYVLRSTFGTKFETFIIYAPSVAYFVSLGVWLSAFFRPEAEHDQAPSKSPEQMAGEVSEYLKVLRSFFGKHHES